MRNSGYNLGKFSHIGYIFGKTWAICKGSLDSANMFGDLLQPIGGLCIWRAFGHPGDTDDAKDWGEDQAMYQFKLWAPVDGKLHPNVVLQIKNGALQRAAGRLSCAF